MKKYTAFEALGLVATSKFFEPDPTDIDSFVGRNFSEHPRISSGDNVTTGIILDEEEDGRAVIILFSLENEDEDPQTFVLEPATYEVHHVDE